MISKSDTYILNPLLTIHDFSEMYSSDKKLYIFNNDTKNKRRIVVSAAAHQLLQSFSTPVSIEEFPEEKKFLRSAIKNNILCLKNDLSTIKQIEPPSKPSYMLFKLTLLKPKFTNQLSKFLLPLTNREFIFFAILFLVVMTVLGLFETAPFTFTFYSSEEILLTVFLTSMAIVIHEFGHAVSAYRFGARNISIGIGWYFIFPVAFADLSESWGFTVKQRMLSTIAGIFYQAIYGAFIFLSYLLTNNICFYMASIAILISILWNLNPLLRLDGYWLLSDLLDTPNLRTHAFSNAIQFFKSPKTFLRKKYTLSILIYGVLSVLLLAYLLIRLSFELYRTKGFGIIEVYSKLIENNHWFFADWLLYVGAFIWKALALAFLGAQIYLFFQRRINNWTMP